MKREIINVLEILDFANKFSSKLHRLVEFKEINTETYSDYINNCLIYDETTKKIVKKNNVEYFSYDIVVEVRKNYNFYEIMDYAEFLVFVECDNFENRFIEFSLDEFRSFIIDLNGWHLEYKERTDLNPSLIC